ncbi:PIG-L family deacetylase [Pseudomonas sp. R11-23-07]|uniref:PIG-L family deacetylase n=1 Tax=Pseudomonas sp. R11-23-07 TaxID=658632 RepID=UPI000F584E3C|nr:PIG-L family deacetylase [Pseudomonas sp. R11-23-07]AZF56398.1 hypothetical protein C4J84_0491 [Pseudomonas sp. R11-23-07]
MSRKQQLLKRHRRNKRIALLIGLLVLIATGVLVAWWLLPILAVLLWAAHEAWFADHLFYSPKDPYAYAFPAGSEQPGLRLEAGRLLLDASLAADETLIVGVELKSSWLGRFLDPALDVLGLETPDRQVFERGVAGRRYLNLTGATEALAAGNIVLRGRFCRIEGQPTLWRFRQPDYRQQRVMVIAPHADDAELAAFSLYSQATQSWIVTLTAGEIEAEHYQHMGLPTAEAARLKGRLRAWDSVAVPRWAGVPEAQCVQLGYFCMQLQAMQAAPDQPQASREADLADTRLFRQFNSFALPGDVDGAPTWHNLIADLRALLLKAQPQVIVLPTPLLDPHADHICAHAAVLEALQGLAWQPDTLLGYANHLHDNDRWPMGDSGAGVALPPHFDAAVALVPCSFNLTLRQQQDKAMALGMMHDLQPRAPFKRRVRKWLQQVLAGRSPSPYGENEFFRKAVRRHELLWVLKQD